MIKWRVEPDQFILDNSELGSQSPTPDSRKALSKPLSVFTSCDGQRKKRNQANVGINDLK